MGALEAGKEHSPSQTASFPLLSCPLFSRRTAGETGWWEDPATSFCPYDARGHAGAHALTSHVWWLLGLPAGDSAPLRVVALQGWVWASPPHGIWLLRGARSPNSGDQAEAPPSPRQGSRSLGGWLSSRHSAWGARGMRDSAELFRKMPPATEAKELVFKEPRFGYRNLDAEFKSIGWTPRTASFFCAADAGWPQTQRGAPCCLLPPLMCKP